MYDLSTAEKDTHTNNVTFTQELANAIHFRLEIMFTNLDGELDFLQLGTMLALAFALLLLIVVLAVIHNLADDRFRQRRHFHEIQTLFLSDGNGFVTL